MTRICGKGLHHLFRGFGQGFAVLDLLRYEQNIGVREHIERPAESVLGAERFATATAFAGLAADWPSARLIEIWNSLPGATAITKFKDRKTAVTRIWNVIQSLGEPVATQGARKLDELTHRDLLDKRLGVMDATAATLAEERAIPIIVFDISQSDAMVRAAKGEQIGTLVRSK